MLIPISVNFSSSENLWYCLLIWTLFNSYKMLKKKQNAEASRLPNWKRRKRLWVKNELTSTVSLGRKKRKCRSMFIPSLSSTLSWPVFNNRYSVPSPIHLIEADRWGRWFRWDLGLGIHDYVAANFILLWNEIVRAFYGFKVIGTSWNLIVNDWFKCDYGIDSCFMYLYILFIYIFLIVELSLCVRVCLCDNVKDISKN